MKKRYLFILLPLFCTLHVFAQEIIKGTIIDEAANTPLVQATIADSASGITVYSDANGKFILKTFSKNSVILVSYVGYSTFRFITKSFDQSVIIGLKKAGLELKDIVIASGTSPLYSTKILSSIDLNAHPAKSAQDLLRLVPGLFIAQHQGGGKAEQIFLRGFDCDHGTDINITVDGMPVNLVAHAHGQGYADLHFLIPELISNYEWGKGPYYTSKGDFTTTGFVNYNTKDFIDKNFVKIEAGAFTTGRLTAAINLLGNKAKQNGQSLYIAGESMYSNGGPFTQVPEHFQRYNFFGKFVTPINNKSNLSIELSTLWSNCVGVHRARFLKERLQKKISMVAGAR